MKDYTQRRLEEFEKKFVKKQDIFGDEKIIFGVNKPNIDEVKSFLSTSITQAIAEERERAVEVLAEHIYNQMPHKTTGKKPRWVVNGNSLKQDEARTIARIVLSPLNSFK